MDEKIFNRIEKKYLIDENVARRIRKVIKKNMHKDGYHKSHVYNIYFDTNNYDLIIKSIEGPEFKQKLRARSYGGYDKVFLEIKTKIKGKEANIGYKRRVLITHEDYDELVSGQKTMHELASRNIETKNDLQIASEVDYLIDYFNLKPRILVYYDRESFIGENNLRITFDSNLSYRNHDLSFDKMEGDQHYFSTDKNTIMEIKAHGIIPLWLAQELSKERAFPARFSKIGKIYEQIRKEQNV